MGGIGPLSAGKAYAVLRDLEYYTPRIDIETVDTLLLRVGKYESKAASLLFEDPLARQWRDDLSHRVPDRARQT